MLDGKHDFRSDTITRPTEAMRRAMAEAEVGDDGRRDDPTVKRLEAMAAERLGKEAGMLVPSGTMGNLVCLLTHCRPGDEILVEKTAHVFNYESGSLAAVAGLVARQLEGHYGALDPAEVKAAIRPESPLFARPRLVCLENTHNTAGGTVIPLENMRSVRGVAREKGLAVHLDGARIFNAAVALGVPASTIAAEADSVTFCLSKGLSAPIGSVVVGSEAFIQEARRKRQMVGGTMRQAGVIAAAGIVALETMVERLAEDHARARRLGEGLAEIPGVGVDLRAVQTNMVMVDPSGLGLSAAEFVKRLAEAHNVWTLSVGPRQVRFVTHRHIDDADVDAALAGVAALAVECRQAGAARRAG